MRGLAAPLTILMSIVTLAPTAAAPATGSPPKTQREVQFFQGLEGLRRLGVPSSFLSRLSERQEVFEGSEFFSEAAGDLDGDGSTDLFAIALDYRFEFGEGAASLVLDDYSLEAKTEVVALSGRDGSTLWRKEYDDFAWPIALKLGDGRRGAVLIHGLFSMLGPISEYQLIFDAVDGSKGKRQWRRSYESVILGTNVGAAGANAPLWLDIFDGVGNGADDILLAVGDFAATYGGFAVTTRSLVIDGATGEEREHPARDLGTNWIVVPMAVDDLNGDGKDDYVVPVSPVPGGGRDAVIARSGQDGGEIWRAEGYDFSDIAWVFPLPDTGGDGIGDFAIATFKSPESWRFESILVDGTAGEALWRHGGWGAFSPGDIDRDGRADVITRDGDVSFGKGKFILSQWAYTGKGKELWARRIESRYKARRCRGSCSIWAGIGWWEVGDLQPDGLTDSFVYQFIEQDPGEDRTFAFTVDGKTGRRLVSGGKGFYALGVAVDGRGTDVAQVNVRRSSLAVTAGRGTDGSPLWHSDVAYELPRVRRDPWLMGMDLSGDRCGDVLVVLRGHRGGLLLALNGADGTLLWSRAIRTKHAHAHQNLIFGDNNTAC